MVSIATNTGTKWRNRFTPVKAFLAVMAIVAVAINLWILPWVPKAAGISFGMIVAMLFINSVTNHKFPWANMYMILLFAEGIIAILAANSLTFRMIAGTLAFIWMTLLVWATAVTLIMVEKDALAEFFKCGQFVFNALSGGIDENKKE